LASTTKFDDRSNLTITTTITTKTTVAATTITT
jgi:hypothetical protein